MEILAWTLVALPGAGVTYTYLGYPLLLSLAARLRRRPGEAQLADPADWPGVTVCVPVYNERHQVPALIDGLLALDYPKDRLQILLMSDASSDGTDELVQEYASRGVELVRSPRRSGKTATEQYAEPFIRHDIVVNTDASIRLDPQAIRHLVRSLQDPSVGVASGRDVSVARAAQVNAGESRYVDVEMRIRGLESRISGIVGASGCLYAMRRELQRRAIPHHLSRDFAGVLLAREVGYRAVSVDEAICYVPRAGSLKREYRRKVRTITQGIATLIHFRRLLNPLHHGAFAWMLFSHKLCRWAVPWLLLPGLAGIALLASHHVSALILLAASLVGLIAAGVGWASPETPLARRLSLPAYALASNVAAMHAAVAAVRGVRSSLWEPTRRDVVTTP